ncbi:baseplate hub protein [Entomobacter blattae]|uniref:Uncharacterized protein n=1 Tax=Entomobacter blattae TaxID=2762277 RepID=A0A7H1NR77_9PROT|nr:hypothetical protein [Entomobacter blattae]QNT78287.1 hypothetical protein JGUZn3_10590 [Entomobacter blattae]
MSGSTMSGSVLGGSLFHQPEGQAPFTHRYINVSVTIPHQAEGTAGGQDHKTILTYEGVSQGAGLAPWGDADRVRPSQPTTVPFINYRIACTVVVLGGKDHPHCSLSIFNMGREKMAALSRFGNMGLFRYANNGQTIGVTVYAGESPTHMTRIFEGGMLQCHADFSSAPDPFLFLQASTLSDIQLKPRMATSFEGDIEAAAIIRQIAEDNGLVFENNGVKTIIHNPYFSGSAREQIAKCAAVGRFNYVVENGLLAIWPLGGGRQRATQSSAQSTTQRAAKITTAQSTAQSNAQSTGSSGDGFAGSEFTGGAGFIGAGFTGNGQEKANAFPLISPQTGLIGYPSFNGTMVGLRCLFRNDIRNGDIIEVKSDFFGASGYYVVHGLSHSLSTEESQGPWFTDIQASGLDPSQ